MSLVLRTVDVTYPDGDQRLTALDAVNLQIEPGELVAVVGPSGSGKSTLLAVSGCLLAPDSGAVEVGGMATATMSHAQRDRIRRDRIGFVFQQANLLGSLTAIDQLLLTVDIRGGSLSAGRRRAAELLERVGLGAKLAKRPHELSGGERQRVGIARALMSAPDVLLLDEPTSALDRDRGRDVFTLIADVTRENGIATMLVTHDVTHLDASDRTLTIRDGRLENP